MMNKHGLYRLCMYVVFVILSLSVKIGSIALQFVVSLGKYEYNINKNLSFSFIDPHDNTMALKRFPHCWPFVSGIHRRIPLIKSQRCAAFVWVLMSFVLYFSFVTTQVLYLQTTLFREIQTLPYPARFYVISFMSTDIKLTREVQRSLHYQV